MRFICPTTSLTVVAKKWLRQFHGITHELDAQVVTGAEDRLGMELHGLQGQVAMAHSHDDAVFRFGCHFETRGSLSGIA